MPTEEKAYEKRTVLIEDEILARRGVIGVGVQVKADEVHLEIYTLDCDGNLHHRDIEVQPDGSYDSGFITEESYIRKRLKKLNEEMKK